MEDRHPHFRCHPVRVSHSLPCPQDARASSSSTSSSTARPSTTPSCLTSLLFVWLSTHGIHPCFPRSANPLPLPQNPDMAKRREELKAIVAEREYQRMVRNIDPQVRRPIDKDWITATSSATCLVAQHPNIHFFFFSGGTFSTRPWTSKKPSASSPSVGGGTCRTSGSGALCISSQLTELPRRQCSIFSPRWSPPSSLASTPPRTSFPTLSRPWFVDHTLTANSNATHHITPQQK